MFSAQNFLKHSFSKINFTENSKKALKDFIKAIHPDLFEKAPTKVKEENERSLKQLNNYIDCLKKNEGSTSIPLKFYAANKDNLKSKKFLFFEVELPAFLPNTALDTLKLHEIDAMKRLNNILYSTQLQNNPFAEEAQRKSDENQHMDFEKTHSGLFVKSSSKQKQLFEIEQMKNDFNGYLFFETRNKMKKDLMKSLKVMYPNMKTTETVSGEVLADLKTQKLHDLLEESRVDFKVFFVDSLIETKNAFYFFEELAKKIKEDVRFSERFEFLQNFLKVKDQKLKIMVSDKNEVKPGFVLVKYNSSQDDWMGFVENSIEEAIGSREQLFEKKDTLKEFQKMLEADFGLKAINLDGDFGERDLETEMNKKVLFLKKLTKVFGNLKNDGKEELWKDLRVDLVRRGVTVSEDKKEWELAWNFDEKRLYKELRN